MKGSTILAVLGGGALLLWLTKKSSAKAVTTTATCPPATPTSRELTGLSQAVTAIGTKHSKSWAVTSTYAATGIVTFTIMADTSGVGPVPGTISAVPKLWLNLIPALKTVAKVCSWDLVQLEAILESSLKAEKLL